MRAVSKERGAFLFGLTLIFSSFRDEEECAVYIAGWGISPPDFAD